MTTTVPVCTEFGAPPKISLVARKDLRDNFEGKKPDIEQFFNETLGEKWQISLDTTGLWSYTQPKERDNFGKSLHSYFESSMRDNLKDFIREYGDDGKTTLASLAHARTITLVPAAEREIPRQEFATCDFKDGTWRFIFKQDEFGEMSHQALANLGKKVSTSEQGSNMCLISRKNVRDAYDSKIGELLQQARQYLALPELKFDPGFEVNYGLYSAWEKELRASSDSSAIKQMDKAWKEQFGQYTLSYFKDLVDNLRSENFATDDILQEGFQEAVTTGTVAFRIGTDEEIKAASGSYNDAVVQDGVLLLRSSKEYFGSNTQYASKNLAKLL